MSREVIEGKRKRVRTAGWLAGLSPLVAALTPLLVGTSVWGVVETGSPMTLSRGAEEMTLASAVGGEGVPATAPASEGHGSDWSLKIGLGLWATSLQGDAGTSRRTTDIDMGFDEVLDYLNFALMPVMEVGVGRWVVAFNGMFSELEAEQTVRFDLPGGGAFEGGGEAKVGLNIADLGVGFVAVDAPLGTSGMRLVLVPALGVRYTCVSLDLEPDRREGRSGSKDWWDPYLGGRAVLEFTPKIAWRTDATVGGFGVGCDRTWSVQSMLDLKVARHLEFNVGYRVLTQDYSDDDFIWDMTLHGPWVGLTVFWN